MKVEVLIIVGSLAAWVALLRLLLYVYSVGRGRLSFLDETAASNNDDDDVEKAIPSACHIPNEATPLLVGKKKKDTQPRIRLMELDNHGALPNVLNFLPFEDLNSLAVCNKRLRDLRADPSLDQTRSGVLVFRDGEDSLLRLDQVIVERNLAGVFTGNRTCLRLKQFVRHLDDANHPSNLNLQNQLPDVTQLQLVYEQKPADPYVTPGRLLAYQLPGILPNVTHLDCSFSKDPFLPSIHIDCFEKLVSWTCMGGEIGTCGRDLRSFKSIRYLYLEGSPGVPYYASSNKSKYLYGFPRNMQRLDIRRVAGYDAQDIAILLRLYTHLRWVRCDVSDNQRADLLLQRPHVKIVNW